MTIAIALALAAVIPDERGPYAVEVWDAGDVAAAGADVPTVVYYPSGAKEKLPVVTVIHGEGGDGGHHAELAATLASYGLIAVVPDLACGVFGCELGPLADQITVLLDWIAAESTRAASPVAGMVDAARPGLIGHGRGGQLAFLVAARSGRAGAVVGLDPTDPGGAVEREIGRLSIPTLHVMAGFRSDCNDDWDARVFAAAHAPRMRITVNESGPCDPAERVDWTCQLRCGGSRPTTNAVFRRYAVAWMACYLRRDGDMNGWIGGDWAFDDQAGAVISQIVGDGIVSKSPCGDAHSDVLGAERAGCGCGGGAPAWLVPLALLALWSRRALS